jgi:hypothetical protein
MAISPTMTGKQMRKINPRYINKNAAPPFCPARYGKRQIFPNPTAEPAAAMMNPKRPEKLPLFDIFYY